MILHGITLILAATVPIIHAQMGFQYTWQPPYFSRAPPPGQHPSLQPPAPQRYAPPAPPTTCSAETCKLPDCFCAGKVPPHNMDRSKMPQIVMFTFDDAINEQVFPFYEELFPAERVNPNGCPITSTFFLSHNWTDYRMVKELYLAGHEIASHSITHRMPQSWWTYATYDTLNRELAGQRDNIVQKASIPKSEVRGVRLPFLETGGDNLYKVLRDQGFEYDASFMTGPHAEGGLYPFTLDFPPKIPEVCGNNNCPKMRWPGIWQVALNRWYGPDGHPCAMVDSCKEQPSHKGEALSYLWQNFNRHYYGNKSPVGVNMHAVWFKTQHHYDAMKEFIATLADMEDVYIVTVYQTIEWMRNPVTLEDAKDFEPWKTSCDGRGKKKLVKMVPRDRPSHGPPTTKRPVQFSVKKEQSQEDIIGKEMPNVKVFRNDEKVKNETPKKKKVPPKAENEAKKEDPKETPQQQEPKPPKVTSKPKSGRPRGQGGKADQQSANKNGRRNSSNVNATHFTLTVGGILMVFMVARVEWL